MNDGEAESKAIRFFLFRNFRVNLGEHPLHGFEAEKPRELFCYLLLNPTRPYYRDALITLLWENNDINHARKNFRQVLWQLTSELRAVLGDVGEALLEVDGDWIRVNASQPIWCDVERFQHIFKRTQGIHGYDLDRTQALALEEAASLYQGDLLEGWYQDWCLFERERLQNMYLMILDKLMEYCETNILYEDGIVHGMQILNVDAAREKTHRCLMKLYYLSGDRTNALRQFEHCVEVLEKELQVGPSQDTIELDASIRSDQLRMPARRRRPTTQPALISSLNQFRRRLSESHQQVSQEIEAIIENLLNEE